MIRCEICNKEVKEAGISNHKRMAHTAEGKAQTRKANAGRRTKQSPAAWNKGLTKETDQRVMNNSVALFGHIVKASTREKLRISAKKQNLGGYIPSGGRGKKGWYKGYWCDSSWELAWIIYHLECGTIFTRNNEKFRYSYNGIAKNYIPDFLLASGEYVEVKVSRMTRPENKKVRSARVTICGVYRYKNILKKFKKTISRGLCPGLICVGPEIVEKKKRIFSKYAQMDRNKLEDDKMETFFWI